MQRPKALVKPDPMSRASGTRHTPATGCLAAADGVEDHDLCNGSAGEAQLAHEPSQTVDCEGTRRRSPSNNC